jgi:4-hydroxythreonine-4-phosphate dehydrogenase
VDEATALVVSGVADALVTAPVSKAVIVDSDAPGAKAFRGHTEYLAAKLGAKDVVMAFVAPGFSTALVTTHVPLRSVPQMLTVRGVTMTCRRLAAMLMKLGNPRPRIVVAALNPHAGESGLLGDEEHTVITPGIRRARERLRRSGFSGKLIGPVGAETAFRQAAAGQYDGVVAMYHDQATIPCKLLGFGEAVNVTLGLPIVRTSVDHGTAYDLAGSGKASDRGMREALLLARALTAAKR